MSRARVVGALLAGGRSSRMGSAKATLVVGGMTLAARAAATLRQVAADCVQVGGEAIPGLGLPLWPDLRVDCGPAAGIEAALAGAAPSPIVVLAVDLPLVPAGLLIHALEETRAGAPIAGRPPASRQRSPAPPPRRSSSWRSICRWSPPGF